MACCRRESRGPTSAFAFPCSADLRYHTAACVLSWGTTFSLLVVKSNIKLCISLAGLRFRKQSGVDAVVLGPYCRDQSQDQQCNRNHFCGGSRRAHKCTFRTIHPKDSVLQWHRAGCVRNSALSTCWDTHEAPTPNSMLGLTRPPVESARVSVRTAICPSVAPPSTCDPAPRCIPASARVALPPGGLTSPPSFFPRILSRSQ